MFRRVLPVLAATLLVACGGGSEPEAAPTSDAPPPAATDAPAPGSSGSSGPDEAPAALQFTAPLVGGGEIELGELAGRPVLLWFWAPW